MSNRPVDHEEPSPHARLAERNARLELELKELAQAAGAMNLAVFVVDRNQNVLQRLVGPRHGDDAGQPDVAGLLTEMGLALDPPLFRALVEDVWTTGVSRDIELRTVDGRWRQVHVRAHQSIAGERASVAVFDIDALKHPVSAATGALATAERNDRTRDELLSFLSHELRTPLTSILVHVQLLQSRELEPSARGSLEAIERGARAQLQVIEDIFDAWRLGEPSGRRVRSRTHDRGGEGLAFALLERVVTMCGGTLTADPRGGGDSATYVMRFPGSAADTDRPSETDEDRGRVADEGRAARALDRPRRARRYDMLPGLRILVVDDDPPTRHAIVEVLALSGAEVRSANSATTAMQVLEAFAPRVLVSDVAMPGEDGYSLIRRIRKHSRLGPELRAIALTALTAENDRWRAREAGFDAHVAKPVDIDGLRDAVAEVLAR